MDQSTHDVRRTNWLNIVNQCQERPVDVSVRQWLADNGIKETYKRLRHEPESWTVEIHTVEVYVGTDGDHQDEFLRGNRPKDLLRNSIVTPSLLASILNVKYVN